MSVDVPAVVNSGWPPAPRGRRPVRTRRRLAVVGVVLLVAVGFLLYKTLTSAVVYFKTASQAVAARSSLGNATFQIEGVVVPGSVHTRDRGALIDFRISSGSTVVAVENDGSAPQLFQPNVPVVLVGHFVGASNAFSSDEILVKHSNSYIAAHPARVRAPNGSTR